MSLLRLKPFQWLPLCYPIEVPFVLFCACKVSTLSKISQRKLTLSLCFSIKFWPASIRLTRINPAIDIHQPMRAFISTSSKRIYYNKKEDGKTSITFSFLIFALWTQTKIIAFDYLQSGNHKAELYWYGRMKILIGVLILRRLLKFISRWQMLLPGTKHCLSQHVIQNGKFLTEGKADRGTDETCNALYLWQ